MRTAAHLAASSGLLFGAAMLLVACASSAALRSHDIERQVAEGLSSQAGGEFVVTCPSSIPAEAGYAFTCTVEDRTGGASLQVSVVEDDAEGGFSWKVASTS